MMRVVVGAVTDRDRPCIAERCRRNRKRGLYCDKCNRRFDVQRSHTRGRQMTTHPVVGRSGFVRRIPGEATLAWPAYTFDPDAYRSTLAAWLS